MIVEGWRKRMSIIWYSLQIAIRNGFDTLIEGEMLKYQMTRQIDTINLYISAIYRLTPMQEENEDEDEDEDEEHKKDHTGL
jgi:hypothetical protein